MANVDSVFDHAHLPLLDTSCEKYSPLSSPRECPSLSESFTSFEMSSSDRRPSFASTSQLTDSPSWLSGKSSGAATPTTPVTAMGTMLYEHHHHHHQHHHNRKVHQTPDTPYGFSRHEMTDIFWEPEAQLPMPITTAPFLNAISEAELPYYPAYSLGMSNPSLSRPIFGIHDVVEEELSWSHHHHHLSSSPQQTIAPSATFQAPLLSSSPIPKHEPCTPIRRALQQHHHSSTYDSSPLGPLMATPVVPSQPEEADDLNDPEWATLMSSSSIRRPHHQHDRLSRRPYERKRIGGAYAQKPKPCSPNNPNSKSGIDCDVVIAQNEFACSYPGCIDKQTGKQKRFKRQEHKKRHEKTVHEKSEHGLYKCWVGGCKTAPFTRTDNLKSHLKNTHGKKSPNQRNRYVATQDRASACYDPDWVGELTEEGFPIR